MRLALKLLLAFALVALLAAVFVARVLVAEVKPGVRQAMEATLVDTANLLAELASADLQAGQLHGGAFARAVGQAQARDPRARIWQFPKRHIALAVRVTGPDGVVVYDSAGLAVGQDHARWNDVLLTLRGQYGARSSPLDPRQPDGASAMHVAAPMRDAAGGLIGVLTVTQPNSAFDPYIVAGGQAILAKGGWLVALVALVGVLVSAWLAWRVGRLRRYAAQLTAGGNGPPPDHSSDEIGQLGRALAEMRRQLDGKAYVEQYVQGLTHEMKSPLAAIAASAELLQQPMADADRARFSAAIASQIQRLTQMIDRLLALAAIERDGWLGQRSAQDLGALCRQVVADVQPVAQGQGIGLVLEVTAAAPVAGDGFLLQQALANLVDNAVDFAHRGPVQVRVLSAEGGWCVQVDDDGPGVPGYALSRVFERFYSLPRPRSGQRSSGLGLNFVAEVARLHGGSVQLENRPAGGARATLWLPAG